MPEVTAMNSKVKESIQALVNSIDRAISIEHGARKFYRDAARYARSADARQLFTWMCSRQDDQELSLWAQRRRILALPEAAGLKAPLNIKKVLEDTNVWSDQVSSFLRDSAIFRTAIANEKRAYAEYQKNYTDANDPLTKSFFKKMVEKQEKQLKLLTERMWDSEVSNAWMGFKDRRIVPQRGK